MDDYPEVDESPWGISPWFKVEVKGQYHRGLEVIPKLAAVELSAKEAREADGDQTETVAIIGRIPFDSIVHIDWAGDEYGNLRTSTADPTRGTARTSRSRCTDCRITGVFGSTSM